MGDWRDAAGALLTLITFGGLAVIAFVLLGGAILYLFLRVQLRSPESATRFLNSHPYLNSFALLLEKDPGAVQGAHCPHSGGVTIVQGVATCGSCGKPWLEIHHRPNREAIPLPREIRIRESSGRMDVCVRRWSWMTRLVGAFFLLFGTLIGLATIPRIAAARSLEGDYTIVVGFVMFYVSLWLLSGRTTLRVEEGRLAIRNGPVWWPGGRVLRTRDLAQLYCNELSVPADSDSGPPMYPYELWAVDRGGARTRLLSVTGRQVALYLEQLLEERLGIEDRPVEGEASKLWVNIR